MRQGAAVDRRRAEFRLALALGAFALTVMLGCFGFMYVASADLRVAMDAQITGLPEPAPARLPCLIHSAGQSLSQVDFHICFFSSFNQIFIQRRKWQNTLSW